MPYHTRQAPGAPRRVPSRSLFRIAQRLNVPPMGKEPVSAGLGLAGVMGTLRLKTLPAHHLAGAHKLRVTYS